eukprot:CAMPEP_0183309070 /NCGR_PEP_ID=MMETSP0160_2-20130417/23776_1 /TAXON_ID=2839 ORGANISM="Odontella Sinensis, Strain Grunow 1884" /NCGR_SAMPLE_ID=MMETSP0160_2 /ASSEMBLY_ACC=CAM_ASM_000250 /LENGTH=107 /DNA_ID=CAMNT_0025473019 /DNA_START=99 /DNA_END=422 /DNA_ORIENTATION=+
MTIAKCLLILTLAVAATAQNGIRSHRGRGGVRKESIVESTLMREATAHQDDADFWDRELGGRTSNSKSKGKGKGKGKGGSKSKGSKSKGKGKGKGGSKSKGKGGSKS